MKCRPRVFEVVWSVELFWETSRQPVVKVLLCLRVFCLVLWFLTKT